MAKRLLEADIDDTEPSSPATATHNLNLFFVESHKARRIEEENPFASFDCLVEATLTHIARREAENPFASFDCLVDDTLRTIESYTGTVERIMLSQTSKKYHKRFSVKMARPKDLRNGLCRTAGLFGSYKLIDYALESQWRVDLFDVLEVAFSTGKLDFILGFDIEYRKEQGVCLFRYKELRRTISEIHYLTWIGKTGNINLVKKLQNAIKIPIHFPYMIAGALSAGKLDFAKAQVDQFKVTLEHLQRFAHVAAINGQCHALDWLEKYEKEQKFFKIRKCWESMVLQVTHEGLLNFIKYSERKNLIGNHSTALGLAAVRVANIDAMEYLEAKFTAVSRVPKSDLKLWGTQMLRDGKEEPFKCLIKCLKKNQTLMRDVDETATTQYKLPIVYLNNDR